MECFGFCTASAYSLKPLFEMLRTKYKAALYRDVIHVEWLDNGQVIDFFFFSYGAAVSWGADRQTSLEFIQQIKPYEMHPYEDFENSDESTYKSDEFTFVYATDNQPAKIVDDEIILPDNDSLSKLAISYAIGQSVKLETFETSIQRTFNNTKHLPEDLAKKGKIFLSRNEIRKMTGQLFIERSSINLHLDVLDTPEIFWQFPEVEHLHKMASVYLDIDTRVEILNQRLDVLHELLGMLGNELNHQHSSRLEWTVILLIVMEVVLTLVDIMKK